MLLTFYDAEDSPAQQRTSQTKKNFPVAEVEKSRSRNSAE